MLTEHPRYGQQLWVLVKLRARKNDDCAVCRVGFGTHAYRPLTNSGNRMIRICGRHNANNLPHATIRIESGISSNSASSSDKL